jgi:hypothetical protein
MEVRTLLNWATLFWIIQSFSSLAFALRLNLLLGINDILFIIMTDTVFGALTMAQYTLPILALFAKITPHKIEGTMFAFLTGTVNLSSTVISPMVAVWLNKRFVGVTATNLSGYKQLCAIGLIASFLGFIFNPLIPLKKDIESW